MLGNLNFKTSGKSFLLFEMMEYWTGKEVKNISRLFQFHQVPEEYLTTKKLESVI